MWISLWFPPPQIPFPSTPLPALRLTPGGFSELNSEPSHPNPGPSVSGSIFPHGEAQKWPKDEAGKEAGVGVREWGERPQTNSTQGKLANRSRVPRRNTCSLPLLAFSSKMATVGSFPWRLKAHLPLLYPAPTVLHD